MATASEPTAVAPLPWPQFRAGFRGRAVPDAPPLVAADVIEMGVACHRDQLALGNKRHPLTKRNDTHATVDKHVTIAAAHMPYVAAIEFLDMRLADIGHIVVKTADTVPVLRAHARFHHVSPRRRPERRWYLP